MLPSNKERANKACIRQVGFCGIFEHFSGLDIFLLPSRILSHPLAGNANRSAASFLAKGYMKTKSIIIVLLVSLVVSSCASTNTVSPTETTTLTATSAPILLTLITSISTDSIAGNWMGSFQGVSDNFSAQILVSINNNCEINNICGTYSAPSLPCSGNLILTRTDNTTFVFIEQKTSGADWCGSGGLEYIELLPDKTLSWEYSDPDESIKSKGILTKVARDGETVQMSTAVISKGNISQLTELAIWGKGTIKKISWSDDGKLIFVKTSIGQYAYDSTSFQPIEMVSNSVVDNPNTQLNVEDLGFQVDSDGHGKHLFRIHIGTDAFDVNSLNFPTAIYISEGDIIAIDNQMGGLELRDKTTYAVIGNVSGSWESPVSITKDRKTVAAGSMDGYITIKSGVDFTNEARFEAGGPVRFLSFSPNGERLISETNGNISIWDTANAKVIGSLPDTFLSGNFFNNPFQRRTDATVGLTVKDNRIAYINKNIVIIRSLLDGKQSGLINGKEGTQLDTEYEYEGGYLEIDSVFFTNDNKSLVTVNYDRAYIWDLSTNQFIGMIAKEKAEGLFGGLVSVYSAPQNLLLTGSQTGNYIKSWNVEDGIQGKNIRAWNVGGLQYGYDGTHSLTMSPDGQYVFSWSGLEGIANLWEIETQKRVMALKIPRSEYSQYQPGFYPVAFSPDNTKLIFSYSLDPELHLSSVYSIPDGTELYQISNYYAVFSPDSSVIAASTGNNQIRFYDSQTGETLGDVTSNYPNQNGFQLLYFSEDGKSGSVPVTSDDKK